MHRILVICGILSSLLYVCMNVVIPMLWEDYHFASQTVSELSAIGAPTRTLWTWLGALYSLLLTAFGVGIWRSADRRSLRITGLCMVAAGLGDPGEGVVVDEGFLEAEGFTDLAGFVGVALGGGEVAEFEVASRSLVFSVVMVLLISGIGLAVMATMWSSSSPAVSAMTSRSSVTSGRSGVPPSGSPGSRPSSGRSLQC